MKKIYFLFITIITLCLAGLPAHAAPAAATINLTTGASLTIERDTITPDTTLSANLAGPGSLIKTGAGYLTLTGSNTYTGDTAINGGTLVLDRNYTVASTLTNNAVLIVNNTLTNSGAVTNTSGLIIINGTTNLNTLTLDANGGAGTITVAELGTAFEMSKLATYSKNPARSGHTLAGWNTAPNGSGTPVTSPHVFTNGDTIFAQWTPDTITIDIAAISGVTPPTLGGTPVTAITETAQYTGAVSWSPAVSGTFAESTVYIATIILTPKMGYTLTGVAANFFTVAGTSSAAANAADSGVITATFPQTEPTYTVTVNGSYSATTGAGSYAQGAAVAINAGTRSGYTFSGWTTSSTGVVFANAGSANTSFPMPANNVTVTANWTLIKESPSLTLTASPSGTLTLPGSVTLTAVLISADTLAGKTITFAGTGISPDPTSTTNSSGEATYTVSPAAGTHSFGAAFAGDANNNAATAASITGYAVNKGVQAALAIDGGNITKTYGDAAFQLTASGGSGTGVVTYTVAGGNDVISITGNTVTILKVGAATVTATKADDANYNSITSPAITITVGKADQSAFIIDGGNITKTYGDAAFQLTTSGGGGTGAVTWNSGNQAAATVNASGLVQIAGVGQTTITATKAADDNYSESSAQITLTVEAKTESVAMVYPSDKKGVSGETGIPEVDLEEKDNKVYLGKSAADRIARELLQVKAVNTNILPVFKGTLSKDGRVMAASFMMSGEDLLVLFPDEIKLIGMISDNEGKLFEYVNSELDYDDMKFTILLNGVIYEGELTPDKEYELLVFIKDGGEFDLDGLVNSAVIASIFLANEKDSSGDNCGCNSVPGFGMVGILMVAVWSCKNIGKLRMV